MATKRAAGTDAATKKLPRGGSHRAGEKRAPAVAAEDAAIEAEKQEAPVRCIHRHAEKEVRKHFRKVCDGLMKKAAEGGITQARLLLQIGGFGEARPARRRRGKTLSQLLLGELKRRQDEREAAPDGKPQAPVKRDGSIAAAGSEGASVNEEKH